MTDEEIQDVVIELSNKTSNSLLEAIDKKCDNYNTKLCIYNRVIHHLSLEFCSIFLDAIRDRE